MKGRDDRDMSGKMAVRKNRKNWKSAGALAKAKFKIHGKSKRQCIKEGLGAEWMGVWRCERQYREYPGVPSNGKPPAGAVSKDELVEDIEEHIFSRFDAGFPKYVLLKLFKRLIEEDEDGAADCFQRMFYTMSEEGMLNTFLGNQRTIRMFAQFAAGEDNLREAIRSFLD